MTFICWLGDCNKRHYIPKNMIKNTILLHTYTIQNICPGYCNLITIYYMKISLLCYIKISDVRFCNINHRQENFRSIEVALHRSSYKELL